MNLPFFARSGFEPNFTRIVCSILHLFVPWYMFATRGTKLHLGLSKSVAVDAFYNLERRHNAS